MKRMISIMVMAVAFATVAQVNASGIPCSTTFDPTTNVCGAADPNSSRHGGQVNISGATLFRGFFTNAASTIDYLDVDGDGYSTQTGYLDQLAPSSYNLDFAAPDNTWWHVIYRGVGSGNGLSELVNYHDRAMWAPLGPPLSYGDEGWINRNRFNNGTAPVLPTHCNTNTRQAGCPVLQQSIDIAALDVPVTLFVTSGNECNSAWFAAPASEGYGQNPLRAYNHPESNKLKSLGALNPALVEEHQIAWVSIAPIANPGAGIPDGNITLAELRHLFATGRMPSGENLVAITRDAGSGTRNGAMNSIGLDPSWGRGDNLDQKTNVGTLTAVGPDHVSTNLGGSSRQTEAVRNRRLGVGYQGLDGTSGTTAGRAFAQNKWVEMLNVEFAEGSGSFVRPTSVDNWGHGTAPLNTIAYNSDPLTGWRMGGMQTFVTIDGYTSCAALDYLNNILASVAAIEDAGAIDPDNYGSPGEYLAYNFTLAAAIEQIADLTDPLTWIDNPSLNQNLLQNEKHVFNFPPFGFAGAGIVPYRFDLAGSATYSDGTRGQYYLTANGTQLTEGTALDASMRVAGDFNNNGVRDVDDLYLMALHLPTFGNHCTYAPAGRESVFSAEITGDFNGDGNLDEEDVRYFADGLVIIDGMLNRKVGFETVDDADVARGGDGNFFGTQIRLGDMYAKAYARGDSRGDVAGSDRGPTPGAGPNGADGHVDEKDIDYMLYILSGGWKCEHYCRDCERKDVRTVSIDLGNLDQAIWADFSLDMNGDGILDYEDYRILVEDIIGLPIGDLNGDGVVDHQDAAIIIANFGMDNPGYLDGDINGDGIVDDRDLDTIRSIADLNKDGKVDLADFAIFAAEWLSSIN